MDHIHAQDRGTMEHADPHVPDGSPMSSFLQGLPETQHNQLLEMLHVPVLHGGVNESFLLSSLTTNSNASFTVACILLATTACILELLRLAVWHFETRYMSKGNTMASSSCRCKHSAFPVLSLKDGKQHYCTMNDSQQQSEDSSDSDSDSSSKTPSRLQRSMTLASLGLLQMLTYLSGTFLMLIAMTMNIFLIVSIGVGTSIGKLISLSLKQHLQAAKK